jgi:phosphonopyruvate decarboxylase
MGIGSLATIGAAAPPNLTIVVLDNGLYGETGGQRSHTALGTDMVAVAAGFGLAAVATTDPAEVAARVTARAATTFVRVAVEPDDPPRAMPPRDGAANKNAFRAALGLPTF